MGYYSVSSEAKVLLGNVFKLNALIIGFPGVDPRDTHGEPPGTCREWYIFDNFLGVRGGDIVWFWKRTLQTPGMHPGDLVAIGQRCMVFKIPDEQLAAICIPFLGSVARLFFIMPLYKAWDVTKKKKVCYCRQFR